MSKKHKPSCPQTCDEQCDHFCYIGEGDTVCTKEMPPTLVMEDWTPTDKFYWCGGRRK